MAGILASAVNVLSSIIIALVFIRVLSSWIPFDKRARWYILLVQFTEPILSPVKKIVQKSSLGSNMMIDISPIVTILLIQVASRLLINIINMVF